MEDSEYRKKYLKMRHAEDAEFRERRKQCSNDDIMRRRGRMPEQSETGGHQP